MSSACLLFSFSDIYIPGDSFSGPSITEFPKTFCTKNGFGIFINARGTIMRKIYGTMLCMIFGILFLILPCMASESGTGDKEGQETQTGQIHIIYEVVDNGHTVVVPTKPGEKGSTVVVPTKPSGKGSTVIVSTKSGNSGSRGQTGRKDSGKKGENRSGKNAGTKGSEKTINSSGKLTPDNAAQTALSLWGVVPTGDSSNLYLWMSLFFISCVVILIVIEKRREQK